MIITLARGEMLNIILPFQAVLLCLAVLAFLSGVPLVASAMIMRDSRDHRTNRSAHLTFIFGMAAMIVPLIMAVACVFIYSSQGGFQ